MQKLKWQIAQFFEVKWWQNYLSKKDKAAYYDWKKKYWLNLIAQINDFSITAEDCMADVGCGPAGVFIAFPNNNLDAFDPLLNEYESKLPFFDKKDFPNCEFHITKAEDISSNKHYAHVFCINAINHFENLEKGVAKITALNSIHFYWSVDAHRFSFLKFIFRLIPADVLHPHQYVIQDYENLLIKNQLKITQCSILRKGLIFNEYLICSVKK